MKGKLRLILSLLVVAALAVPAGAVVVAPVDVAAAVDQADLIFVGKVVGMKSVPTADGSFAFTYITFDVEETLKGNASGRTLTLRFAGGEVGTDVFEVVGAPRFQEGGRHILFVEGNDRLGIPLVGWHQGKLDIVAHPLHGRPIVLDYRRRAIDGIDGDAWRQEGMALDREGGIKRPKPEVEVVSEEGVKISGLPAAPRAVEDAEPASSVIRDLRTFVAKRKNAPSFREAVTVESASPTNVPASLTYRAMRATEK